MTHKTGRNEPCPCGSGKKYKKCCMQKIELQHTENRQWMDEEGMHFVGNGVAPSPEEQEIMTKEYQEKIRNSPMWRQMVDEYGKEKAEEMLKEFQVKLSD